MKNTDKGHIEIKQDDNNNFIVKVKLVNGNVWLSKWQMATLFNVYEKTIENNLKAIFKAGLLRENEVSKLHTFTNEDKEYVEILYNLETLIFVGFRIASFEAKAFREWVLKVFSEYMKNDKSKKSNILIAINSNSKIPFITSYN